MSASLQVPQTPGFLFKLPDGFVARLNSLKAALPSHGDSTLHEELSSRFQSFRAVMAAASELNGIADRYYQDFLWVTSRETGVTLSLLTAMGHGATLSANASIVFQLVRCVNPILAAGIKSNHIFSPLSDDHADIILAAAEVIPKAMSACWQELRERICSSERPLTTDLLHLEYLVELVCLACQLMERGRDPKAMVWPTESEALRELKLQMKNSEALEDLMLQFLIHRDKSSQFTRAFASFSRIFGSGLSLLIITNNPQRFNNLLITWQGISMSKDLATARVDNSRYSTMYVWLSFGYWEFVRSAEDRLREEELLKLNIRTLLAACVLHLNKSLASLLVFQRAFVPLVARGLLAWQLLGDNALGDTNEPGTYNWKDLLRCRIKAIGTSLQEASSGLKDEIISSTGFTPPLEMLRRAKSLKPDAVRSADQPIHIWKDFCGIGQLDEWTYCQERRRVGCAWVMCPLYGADTLPKDDSLVCTTCGSVYYCGEFCQERDWGRHRDLECCGAAK